MDNNIETSKEVVDTRLDVTSFLGPNHADQEAVKHFETTSLPAAVSFYL
jgi:hypothetical protein